MQEQKISPCNRNFGVSSCSAVKYGWLYTNEQERQKYLALKKSKQNFNAKITVKEKIQTDLN